MRGPRSPGTGTPPFAPVTDGEAPLVQRSLFSPVGPTKTVRYQSITRMSDYADRSFEVRPRLAPHHSPPSRHPSLPAAAHSTSSLPPSQELRYEDYMRNGGTVPAPEKVQTVDETIGNALKKQKSGGGGGGPRPSPLFPSTSGGSAPSLNLAEVEGTPSTFEMMRAASPPPSPPEGERIQGTGRGMRLLNVTLYLSFT